MKHRKVVNEWCEVEFSATHRTIGGKINDFLKLAPPFDSDADVNNEIFNENHTILRDWEGDFIGIHIYNSDTTKGLIRFICEKIGSEYEDLKHLDFKLVC